MYFTYFCYNIIVYYRLFAVDSDVHTVEVNAHAVHSWATTVYAFN